MLTQSLPQVYKHTMKLWRILASVVLSVALIGALVGRTMPMPRADAGEMAAMMQMACSEDGKSSQASHVPSDCFVGISCQSLVGLPQMFSSGADSIAQSGVTYATTTSEGFGRNIAPDIEPPKLNA